MPRPTQWGVVRPAARAQSIVRDHVGDSPMRAPRRLLAVLLIAAVGLLALAYTGLFNWISSVLFLLLELLAESLRPLLVRRRHPHRGTQQGRPRSPAGE